MSSRPSNAPLAPNKIKDIREMIANGMSIIDTAAALRTGKATIDKYAGDILAERRVAQRDARLARLQRILKANESAGVSGDRAEVAARFGLKNARVLSKTAVMAKHALGMPVQPRRTKETAGDAGSQACAAWIIALAKCGFTAAEIAQKTGWSENVVRGLARPHLMDGKAARSRRACDRHREIATVYDSAPRGKRAALVEMFGVANLATLKVMACRGRKLLASEARA